MRFNVVTFVLAFVISGAAHCVSAHEKVLQLFTENFPPYNFVEDDKLQGINYDIVAAACEMAGIQCEFTMDNWNRAYDTALNQTDTGVFTTARSPKREDLFSWVGPLIYSNACFYRLRSRHDILVENEQDLFNYTVGISRGDIYQDVLNDMGMEEGKGYLTFSNKHEDNRMFALNKLDLMIGSSLTLAWQLERIGLSPEHVEPVMELNDDALGGNHLALNKNTDPAIVSALQSAVDSMLADNTLSEIVARYVEPQDEEFTQNRHLKRCLDGSTNITKIEQ